MKNLTSYLFVMFMGMYWAFRIIVALLFNLGVEFAIVPYDLTYEIVLLFLTLVAMILIIKRKMLGGIIYFIGYELYFGATVLSLVTKLVENSSLNNYLELIVTVVGIILPIMILIDLLVDKGRKANPVDKKTDWFYKNKDYDRQFDERADRNEYRF